MHAERYQPTMRTPPRLARTRARPLLSLRFNSSVASRRRHARARKGVNFVNFGYSDTVSVGHIADT